MNDRTNIDLTNNDDDYRAFYTEFKRISREEIEHGLEKGRKYRTGSEQVHASDDFDLENNTSVNPYPILDYRDESAFCDNEEFQGFTEDVGTLAERTRLYPERTKRENTSVDTDVDGQTDFAAFVPDEQAKQYVDEYEKSVSIDYDTDSFETIVQKSMNKPVISETGERLYELAINTGVYRSEEEEAELKKKRILRRLGKLRATEKKEHTKRAKQETQIAKKEKTKKTKANNEPTKSVKQGNKPSTAKKSIYKNQEKNAPDKTTDTVVKKVGKIQTQENRKSSVPSLVKIKLDRTKKHRYEMYSRDDFSRSIKHLRDKQHTDMMNSILFGSAVVLSLVLSVLYETLVKTGLYKYPRFYIGVQIALILVCVFVFREKFFVGISGILKGRAGSSSIITVELIFSFVQSLLFAFNYEKFNLSAKLISPCLLLSALILFIGDIFLDMNAVSTLKFYEKADTDNKLLRIFNYTKGNKSKKIIAPVRCSFAEHLSYEVQNPLTDEDNLSFYLSFALSIVSCIAVGIIRRNAIEAITTGCVVFAVMSLSACVFVKSVLLFAINKKSMKHSSNIVNYRYARLLDESELMTLYDKEVIDPSSSSVEQLVMVGDQDPQNALNIIYTCFKEPDSPLADALSKKFEDIKEYDCSDFISYRGLGVKATIQGREIVFGTAELQENSSVSVFDMGKCQGDYTMYLSVDGSVICGLDIIIGILPGAYKFIRSFVSKKKKIVFSTADPFLTTGLIASKCQMHINSIQTADSRTNSLLFSKKEKILDSADCAPIGGRNLGDRLYLLNQARRLSFADKRLPVITVAICLAVSLLLIILCCLGRVYYITNLILLLIQAVPIAVGLIACLPVGRGGRKDKTD